ncbi:hypothetical protein [Bacillus sp. SA1-12]|nr:hypothetical protein [Bacillus sp. SA1-12]
MHRAATGGLCSVYAEEVHRLSGKRASLAAINHSANEEIATKYTETVF